MSEQSNNQGRAYEYICIMTLCEEIQKARPATVLLNSAYTANKNAWESISTPLQEILTESAKAAVVTIFDMEPMILEQSDDIVVLKLQTDKEGKEGDVRDIVIERKDVQWEIGLSIKHNHFAVKHSRLGKGLDFGEKWFGIPCSTTYWTDIKPIFDYLTEQKVLDKKGHVKLEKTTFGSVELPAMAEKYDEIELIGLCTNICVVSNAMLLKASFPEKEISVKEECCAGVTPDKHKAALEVMASCQINII